MDRTPPALSRSWRAPRRHRCIGRTSAERNYAVNVNGPPATHRAANLQLSQCARFRLFGLKPAQPSVLSLVIEHVSFTSYPYTWHLRNAPVALLALLGSVAVFLGRFGPSRMFLSQFLPSGSFCDVPGHLGTPSTPHYDPLTLY